MAKLTVEERLEDAIRGAARDADPAQPSRQVAEDLYELEPKLIEHFSREWITEKLTALIRHHRAKLRAEDDPQMLLGFTVPRKITLKSGAKIPIGNATLRKLRQYRAIVWKDERKHKHPEIAKLDKAIDLMKPHVKEHRGITYSQVVRLEVEKKPRRDLK